MPWVSSAILSYLDPPSKKEMSEVDESISRRAKPRFLLDENFPTTAASILRDMGAKVITAREGALTRNPDENYLAYSKRHKLVLLSCDRDFLDERKHPLISCPALAVFDFGPASKEDVRLAFRALHQVFIAPYFYDSWTKIDATRNEWTQSFRYQDGSTSRRRFRFVGNSIEEWQAE